MRPATIWSRYKWTITYILVWLLSLIIGVIIWITAVRVTAGDC